VGERSEPRSEERNEAGRFAQRLVGREVARRPSMVFTCAVPETRVNTIEGRLLTRRSALLGGLGILGLGTTALAIAACQGQPQAKTVEQAVGSDPLGPLYTETVTLIAAYDRAIADSPDLAAALGRLRDEHRQHARAIAGLMGTVNPVISPAPNASGASISPSEAATMPPSVPPSSQSPSLASLVTAEKTAQVNAANACKAASEARVATLAAISACRATHVAALGALR
jgi:hypothetical protein